MRPENEVLKNITFQANDWEFYDSDSIIKDAVPESKPIGFFGDAMLRFKKNKASMFSFFLICLIIIMAIAGPSMSQFTYREQHVEWDKLPPRIPFLENFGIFDGTSVIKVQRRNIETTYKDVYIETVREYETPLSGGRTAEMADIKINAYKQKGADDVYYWFGSDSLGRDLWTRLWRGARVSLLMSVLAVALNLSIGVFYGSVSAYYGKWTDLIMQRIVEILGSIPTLPLLILFIVKYGSDVRTIVLALCITGWLGMANMIRAQFYRYKGQEYVLAARVTGASDKRVIFRYILPNAIGPTITQVAVAIPSFIMTESYLAYLGLGIRAPEPSVGTLLSDGQGVLFTSPHLVLYPAIVISVLMLAFNLMANGLRDAFDPTLRGN